MYFDNKLCVGTPNFLKETPSTYSRFQSNPRVVHNMTFVGIKIETISTCFCLHKHKYLATLQPLPPSCTETISTGFRLHQRKCLATIQSLTPSCTLVQFKSLRHLLAWICHTCTEICAPINILFQINSASFLPKHIRGINNVLQRPQNSPARRITKYHFNPDKLEIVAYMNSSFY